MHKDRMSRPHGFTLIELLAVIAIISLLIALLVPAVSNVRDQARRASSRAQLDAIAKGCEMFHGDLGSYPRSAGPNPFEGNSNIRLSGAQWLALQLLGADFQGYVKPERRNDTDGNGTIDAVDWRNWYNPAWVPPAGVGAPTRLSLYVEVTGRIAQSPELWVRDAGLGDPAQVLPASLQAGSSDFRNSRVPFFVDTFGAPILYYAANAEAKLAFSDPPGGAAARGRYDQADNDQLTGSEAPSSTNEPGLDLGAGLPHKLRKLGWRAATPLTAPEGDSFAAALYDRGLFEQSGRVWPRRPDSFILIAPGKDALYGTSDDITNF